MNGGSQRLDQERVDAVEDVTRERRKKGKGWRADVPKGEEEVDSDELFRLKPMCDCLLRDSQQ